MVDFRLRHAICPEVLYCSLGLHVQNGFGAKTIKIKAATKLVKVVKTNRTPQSFFALPYGWQI